MGSTEYDGPALASIALRALPTPLRLSPNAIALISTHPDKYISLLETRGLREQVKVFSNPDGIQDAIKYVAHK